MSPEITIKEAERGFLDFTMRYSNKWSVVAKRNTPVLKADTSTVYFYVKTNLSDAAAAFTLTDASAAQIEWLDENEGKIRVKLGTNTEGQVGDNQWYELRVKLTDATWITVEQGRIHIKDSVVDTP